MLSKGKPAAEGGRTAGNSGSISTNGASEK
jgi:hypothetical protein